MNYLLHIQQEVIFCFNNKLKIYIDPVISERTRLEENFS